MMGSFGRSIKMMKPLDRDSCGYFTEREYDNVFEFRPANESDVPEAYQHGAPHEIWSMGDECWKGAIIGRSVAWIAIDELPGGGVAWEKWHIGGVEYKECVK